MKHDETFESIKTNQSLGNWLIRNFNRKFNANASNVDDVINRLRSMKVSNKGILDLAMAYNTPAGVLW